MKTNGVTLGASTDESTIQRDDGGVALEAAIIEPGRRLLLNCGGYNSQVIDIHINCVLTYYSQSIMSCLVVNFR